MAVTTERCTDGIVKPLPPEWFIDQGTKRRDALGGDARPGRAGPDGALLRPQPHLDADHRPAHLPARAVRARPARRPVSFTYDELTAMPSRERTVAIECAGNGRSLFTSQQGMEVPGTAWGLGAIGVTRWRGVPLAEVLERAGIRDDAVDLMPVGLDAPYVADGIDHGRVRRPLPVGKALDDVLLAYEMNGETLPPDHGFPVRLVVPGWIGIASVKWVGEHRGLDGAAVVAVEHEVVPAVVLRAGGQERVRAAVGRRPAARPHAASCTAARGRRAARSGAST